MEGEGTSPCLLKHPEHHVHGDVRVETLESRPAVGPEELIDSRMFVLDSGDECLGTIPNGIAGSSGILCQQNGHRPVEVSDDGFDSTSPALCIEQDVDGQLHGRTVESVDAASR